MIPVPDRFDFPLVAQNHFFKTGIAVEVGAWEGEYAKKALRQWKGKYFLVDTWEHRKADADKVLNDKNLEKPEDWDQVMMKVNENIAYYKDRATILKGYSVDLAGTFQDHSIDWVFIDAGHDYDNAMADLLAWWPKVRPGGFFTGDDYGLSVDAKYLEPLTVKRWKDRFEGMAVAWRWGTANALHEFTESLGLELHVTYMNDNYPNIPAWYIQKPL
jgi:predicted O-methyltransferase YrrM